MGEEEMPEYEKRRLARISENKARLEALGLSRLASSLISSSSKQQSKARSLKTSKDKTGVDHEDDEEYRPSDDDGGLEKNDNVESSEDSEEVEEDARVSSCSRSKGKKRSSLIAAKGTRGTTAKEGLNESYFINDEEALMQAISLSLGVTTSNSPGTCVGISQNFVANVAVKDRQGKIYKAMTPGFAGRKKARNLDKARVQLTEDEMVAYFFSFDETGKGYITPRDVKKMVTAHDFSWSDNEIAHMIHCFDRDEDGKFITTSSRSLWLKQYPCAWHHKLSSALELFGFLNAVNDTSCFMLKLSSACDSERLGLPILATKLTILNAEIPFIGLL